MQTINFHDGTHYTPSKIVAVFRNYVDHIKEMNSEQTEDPVLFLKPTTALADISDPIKIPTNHGSVHFELELAICIKRECSGITLENVDEYIAGYGIALDLTLRDIQAKAKQKGLPWAVAKGFDFSCPVSKFQQKTIDEVSDTNLQLSLNDRLKQNANTKQMIFPITKLLQYISLFFTLLPGDIVLTGTPAGVGPLSPGDKISASIGCLETINTHVIT